MDHSRTDLTQSVHFGTPRLSEKSPKLTIPPPRGCKALKPLYTCLLLAPATFRLGEASSLLLPLPFEFPSLSRPLLSVGTLLLQAQGRLHEAGDELVQQALSWLVRAFRPALPEVLDVRDDEGGRLKGPGRISEPGIRGPDRSASAQ